MKKSAIVALSSALVLASFSAFAGGPQQHAGVQRGAQSSPAPAANRTRTVTTAPVAHRAPAPAAGAHVTPPAARH